MLNKPISILFVEDLNIVRHGIKLCLKTQNNFNCVVSEATSFSEALELLKTHFFDVILFDLSLPDGEYCANLRKLKELKMINKTLVLTSNKDEQIIRKCFSIGSNGYVLKMCSPEELVKAIRTIYRGDKYYCSEAAQALLNSNKKGLVDSPENDGLSERESEILDLIAKDLKNKNMAKELFISIRTVEGHRRNIRKKLNIKTTAGLIKYAMERSKNR